MTENRAAQRLRYGLQGMAVENRGSQADLAVDTRPDQIWAMLSTRFEGDLP
ncbi:MAG: hypothetical protein M3072_07495 [Candidatus Dormibacteraeota bacterium]|nr:hypothetical protein [Candidatus Dormibacteraeota bacterium]